MWKIRTAVASTATLLGFTMLHFVSHGYTRLESHVLGHLRATKAAMISGLATDFGYVPAPTVEEELSPNILCTMEAVKRDINPAYVCSLLSAESEGDPYAVSPKGAMGLMQIMPFNVPRCGACGVTTKKDLFDPQKNVCCGVLLFDAELKRYGDDPIRALESYNGGPGCVGKCAESLKHRDKVLRRAVRVVS